MIPQLISTSVSRVRHLATGTARGGVGLVLTVVGKVLPGGDSPRPTAYAPPSGARPSLRDDISPPAPEVDATPVTQPPAPEPTPTPGATTTMADPAPATTTPAVARTAKRATARQAPATKQAPVKKSAAAKATSTKSPATKTVATKAPAKKAAATKAAATKAPAAALDEPVSPVVDDPIVHSSGPDVAETVRADELKQLQPED